VDVANLKGQLQSVPTCPRCGEPGSHSSPAECLAALRLAIDHTSPIEGPEVLLGLLCSWCGRIVREPQGVSADRPQSWSHGICKACQTQLACKPHRPREAQSRPRHTRA
jgi:hypothetical protein